MPVRARRSSHVPPAEPGDAVFVIRLWCERLEGHGDEAHWRGRVQHVNTGRGKAINDPGQAFDFIQKVLRKLAKAGRVSAPP